jgi:hypothetical protein
MCKPHAPHTHAHIHTPQQRRIPSPFAARAKPNSHWAADCCLRPVRHQRPTSSGQDDAKCGEGRTQKGKQKKTHRRLKGSPPTESLPSHPREACRNARTSLKASSSRRPPGPRPEKTTRSILGACRAASPRPHQWELDGASDWLSAHSLPPSRAAVKVEVGGGGERGVLNSSEHGSRPDWDAPTERDEGEWYEADETARNLVETRRERDKALQLGCLV